MFMSPGVNGSLITNSPQILTWAGGNVYQLWYYYLHILLFILEPTNQKNIFEEEYFKKEQQKVNQQNQENAISFVKAIVLFISCLNAVLTTKEFSKYIHVSSNFVMISKTLSPETP